jgi:ADP-heptose:LPS heptosyltransferase
MNAASPWLQAKNLLAVRMDNAGDVVMLGPALRAIKTASPDARITLLASPAGTLAAALLPWIDDVVTWRAIWQDLGHLPWDPAREHDLVALLRERRFDGALVFTSFSQSPLPPAYACLLAGIPLRAGESAEFGGKVLSHEVKGTPHAAHQVERNLRLVELLGFPAADRALAVAITDAVRADAAARLRALGIDPGSPWALIHPGASAVARRYPPTAWGQVARALEARGVRTLLTGQSKR